MCGLVAVYSKKGKKASQQVFQIYKNQAGRGRQGYGYVAIQDGKLVSIQRAKTEEEIKKLLMKEEAGLILFHHRAPTSTKNTVGTTHPIFVSNPELEYDYYLAHNGVITNDTFLKSKHERLGYKYTTEFHEHVVATYNDGRSEVLDTETAVFNDSECLAIEFARYVEGKEDRINTVGEAAFWAISLEKGTNNVLNVYLGKNKGRDLKLIKNKKWFGFSSESGKDIKDMKLYTINFEDLDIYESDLVMDEAKPVGSTQTRMGFQERDFDRLPQMVKSLEERVPPEIFAYNALVNRYYTYNEALDSGVPLSEFHLSYVENRQYYIPKKFTGIDVKDRGFVSDLPFDRNVPSLLGEVEDEDKEYTEKAKKRLNQLAEEFAENLYKIELFDNRLEKNQMTSIAHKEATDKLEMENQLLEEQMSALGFDADVIEETLDIAKDLCDYNHSYDSFKPHTDEEENYSVITM